MDYDQQEYADTPELNTSLENDPSNVLNQISSAHFPEVEPESHNTSTEKKPSSLKPPNNENLGQPVMSNLSSINNILPCSETVNTLKPIREEDLKPISESLNNAESSRRFDILSTRIKTEPHSAGFVKPPLTNNAKPHVNQIEVARGLASLHDKVDQLLKRRSVSRESARDISTDRTMISDRYQRSTSIDGKRETEANYSTNMSNISTILKKPPQSAVDVGTVVPRERMSADIMTSSRTCFSIELNQNKASEDMETRITEYKETKTIPKPSPTKQRSCQDLGVKERLDSSIIKEKTPSKEIRSVSNLQESTVISTNLDYTRESHRNSSRQIPTTYDNIKIPRPTPPPVPQEMPVRRPPKYDEKKLEDILSKIRERNSVSPAPQPRSSITNAANNNYSKTPAPASKKESEYRRDIKTEEKPYGVPSMWNLSTVVRETERSFDEIQQEKFEFISNANTSILDLLDKKKSTTMFEIEEGVKLNNISQSQISKVGQEDYNSQISAKKQTFSNEKLDKELFGKRSTTVFEIEEGMKINNISQSQINKAVPEDYTNQTSAKKQIFNNAKVDKDNFSNLHLNNIDLPEILKNIQIGKSIKLKTSFAKDNTTSEEVPIPKKPEFVQQNAKNIVGNILEKREINIEKASSKNVEQKIEESLKSGASDTLEVTKDSVKYYCGEALSDFDSVFDPSRGSMRQEESRIKDIRCLTIEIEGNSEEINRAKRQKTSNKEKTPLKIATNESEESHNQTNTRSFNNRSQEQFNPTRKRSLEKVEKVNDSRIFSASGNKLSTTKENLRPSENERRPNPFLQGIEKCDKHLSTSPNQEEDLSLILDESVFCMKNESPLVGGVTADRLFNTNRFGERQSLRLREYLGVDLNNTPVKNRLTEDDDDVSDFDFDRNRLETQEIDGNLISARTLKLKMCKFEQDIKEQPESKRQKASERVSERSCGSNGTFGSGEKGVPKTETVFRQVIFGRKR